MEDGEEKLELVEEANADEEEEKAELDPVEEQNLPDGETERSTGPLDLVLVGIVERKSEREREVGREEGKRGGGETFFSWDVFRKGPQIGRAHV